MDVEFHAARMRAAAHGLTSIGEQSIEHGVTPAVDQGHMGDMLNAACQVWQRNLDTSRAGTQELAQSVHSAIAAMQLTEDNNTANADSVRSYLLH